MVAKVQTNYKLTDQLTGINRTISAWDKEDLQNKINLFLKKTGAKQDDLDVEQSKITYSPKYKYDGILFHSRVMLVRYQDLKFLELTGAITDLKIRPRYTLIEEYSFDGQQYKEIKFRAEYEYYDTVTGRIVIEDYKTSYNTARERLLKQLFIYLYKDLAEIRFINAETYQPLDRPTIVDYEGDIND